MRLVIPSTKQIESRMLDFPDPLRPVMALKDASKPETCVRTGYDLKPSMMSSSIRIFAGVRGWCRRDGELVVRSRLSQPLDAGSQRCGEVALRGLD